MAFNNLLLTIVVLSAATVSQGQQDAASTWCKTGGVCHGKDFFLFQKAATAAHCSEACFKARFKGHTCNYYSYSAQEAGCFLYEDCGEIGAISLKLPKDTYIEAGELSSYETCKFTQYAKDVWYQPDVSTLKFRQTSTGWGGAAKRGMDGNTNSHWGGGSCTHTHHHQGAWWEVEFPENVAISKVRSINRGDCCWHRLRTYQVLVDDVVCGEGGTTTRGGLDDVECGATGKKLKIQLKNRDFLTLCEVQVMSQELVNKSGEPWLL